MFDRTLLLFGKERFLSYTGKKVLIVGLGGVGGAAAISLVRSGVKFLGLCDFDKVELSNFNRQVVANTDTLGKLKTEAFQEILKKINPEIKLKLFSEKVTTDILDEFDFVIEAIDDLKSKIEVIKYLTEKKIPFISSMGAMGKLDPSLVKITTLKKTSADPLARILRHELKGYNFPVVSSTEVPNKTKGTFEPVTKNFGLLLASYCIKELSK